MLTQILFLLAVRLLEMRRLAASLSPTRSLVYIGDVSLEQAGLAHPLFIIALQLSRAFVDRVRQAPASAQREQRLSAAVRCVVVVDVCTCVCVRSFVCACVKCMCANARSVKASSLIVAFCHRVPAVRQIADQYLFDVIDRCVSVCARACLTLHMIVSFPQVLWSTSCLTRLLDVLDVVGRSVEQRSYTYAAMLPSEHKQRYDAAVVCCVVLCGVMCTCNLNTRAQQCAHRGCTQRRRRVACDVDKRHDVRVVCIVLCAQCVTNNTCVCSASDTTRARNAIDVDLPDTIKGKQELLKDIIALGRQVRCA
jgi:hypothetical protein